MRVFVPSPPGLAWGLNEIIHGKEKATQSQVFREFELLRPMISRLVNSKLSLEDGLFLLLNKANTSVQSFPSSMLHKGHLETFNKTWMEGSDFTQLPSWMGEGPWCWTLCDPGRSLCNPATRLQLPMQVDCVEVLQPQQEETEAYATYTLWKPGPSTGPHRPCWTCLRCNHVGGDKRCS